MGEGSGETGIAPLTRAEIAVKQGSRR